MILLSSSSMYVYIIIIIIILSLKKKIGCVSVKWCWRLVSFMKDLTANPKEHVGV